MKKLQMAVTALVLSFPALAKGAPPEMSLGFNVSPDRTRASLDMIARTKSDLGTAWGFSFGNSEFSKMFQGEQVTVKSADVSFLFGYWSNKEKLHRFGHHEYIGLGFSNYYVLPQEHEAGSLAGHAKLGAGLDWYVLRRPEKYVLALVLDGMLTTSPVPLRSRSNGSVQRVFLSNSSLQFGLRLWFIGVKSNPRI